MNRSLKSVCDPLPQLSNLRSSGFFVCPEFKIIKLVVVVVVVSVVFVVVDWTAGMGTIASRVVCP